MSRMKKKSKSDKTSKKRLPKKVKETPIFDKEVIKPSLNKEAVKPSLNEEAIKSSLDKEGVTPALNKEAIRSSFDKEGVKKPSEFQWITLFKYTVVLGLLFSFVFLVAFWGMVGGRKEHVLENFTDKDLIVALKWLQEHDLKPVVYEKLDSEIDRFRIISQNPEPGILVKKGRTIALVVSVGTKLEVMTDFIASDFRSARKQIYTQLTGEHRIPRIVKIERFSPTYEEGIIIDQIPRPGERIDLEKDIVFFVSRGIITDDVLVEDYRLQRYQKVYDKLSEAGINVQARFLTTTDSSRVGVIFEQTVVPGTRLIQGDEINFVVAVKSDEVIEAESQVNVEKLRILTMRVPFPVSSLQEVSKTLEDTKAVKKTPFFCPCLADSDIYIDKYLGGEETNEDTGAVTETVVRKVELVITDLANRERRIVYDDILAGRNVALPYRSIGSGSLSVYLDGEFYRNETFYDK